MNGLKIAIPVALFFLLFKKKSAPKTGITVTKIDPATQTVWFTLFYDGIKVDRSISAESSTSADRFYFETIRNYDFMVRFDTGSTLTFQVYDTNTAHLYFTQAYTFNQPSIGSKFHYTTNCIVDNGDDISEMVENSHEVTWATFFKNVSKEHIYDLFPMYKQMKLKIENDWSVIPYRGILRGEKVFFIKHSGIEYIFSQN